MKRSPLQRKTPLKAKTVLRAKKGLKRTTGAKKRIKKRNKDGSLAKSERIRILKKKLWQVFSQYIRLSYADHTGWLTTCDGKWVFWKDCDCGHLRHNTERNASLGGNALWYYENNFAPQSNQGNRLNEDDSAQKYMLWAINKYGKKEVEKMFEMRNEYKLWTEEELQNKYQYYREKVNKVWL